MNSAHEIVPCQDCGEQTIAARPVCNLCEADKGLFESPAAPAPAASATAVDVLVPMPRTLGESVLAAGSVAHRAALNEMTGQDGYVVRRIHEALCRTLAAQYGTVQVAGTPAPGAKSGALLVMLPQVLDDDLWRAGIKGFRAALNERTGQDRYVVSKTYAALFEHLARILKDKVDATRSKY
jgi:hypothetical protein